jgi:predicted dienelactone hydrolase
MDAAVVDTSWTDPSRDRTVPVRLYFPQGGGPCPAVVVSHATGGSREEYAYLGRHWSAHGYVSVHLQHPGSDVDCWRGKAGGAVPAMRRAAADPQCYLDRVDDVRFALDRLEAAVGIFSGRVDPRRIGVAGHSFGAATALATAGQIFLDPAGQERCRADARVQAVLVMSAPRPWSLAEGDLDRTFAAIRVPCLHFTGTRDDSPLNDTQAADRRVPFDRVRGAPGILVTFAGGDHMVFAGSRRRFDGGPLDAVIHEMVRRASLSFWDATLRDDQDAGRWLHEGGLAALVGENGVVETRAR